MKEEFLNFIWRHQYFNKTGLQTGQGDLLQIIYPGKLNSNAGPDFSQAKIRIGNTVWVGPVEVHVKSTDWKLHNHHRDPHYDQVILHVVWLNNSAVSTRVGQEIPVLELKNIVDQKILLAHQKLDLSPHRIPCHSQLMNVSSVKYVQMMDIAFSNRLRKKSLEVLKLLHHFNHDWDQVTYIVLGKSFGFNINSGPFERLVRLVPLSIVRKSRSSLFQLEALYFGQAGFLGKIAGDNYYLRLQAEFQYLRKKYSFHGRTVKEYMWNYLRLRPSNFPNLRIAQFAELMRQGEFLFSTIREANSIWDFTRIIVKPSDYWDYHYDFGKAWTINKSRLGKSSLENLVINTVFPVLSAYAQYTGQEVYLQRAIDLCRQLPAEKNRIVTYWKDLGFKVSSAYDSQALIELYNHYCTSSRCLDCSIGKSILTQK